jgi:hypothetical protein
MDERDQYLWQLAKKRAGFKKHLASYIIINGFLWALWFFTSRGHSEDDYNGVPWPIWTSLGWGVGLAFSYYNAYMNNQESDTMNEYQKLKDKEQGK